MNVRVPILLGVVMTSLISIQSEVAAQIGPSDSPGEYRPQVGQPHADFELPNIESGEKVSLAQFRGKKLLLLHFASW